jgi:hypothetical protein
MTEVYQLVGLYLWFIFSLTIGLMVVDAIVHNGEEK